MFQEVIPSFIRCAVLCWVRCTVAVAVAVAVEWWSEREYGAQEQHECSRNAVKGAVLIGISSAINSKDMRLPQPLVLYIITC
jgi:hypothetical protein